MGLMIGIDTGGTFTVLVALGSETGQLIAHKTSSTPQSPGQAIANSLLEGGAGDSTVTSFTHGTTVGTNSLIERTGCRVGFLTTTGFEDTPYIQRINRKVLYDLQWQKPSPLVGSRRICLGIGERLDANGNVVRPLDEAEVRARCKTLREEQAQAGRDLPALLLREYRSRGASSRDREGRAPRRAGLDLSSGCPDLARVRASEQDDCRCVSEAAPARLYREPRRRLARRGDHA